MKERFLRSSCHMQRSLVMPEQNTSVNVNKASSVENQTAVPDKLERMADEDQVVKETPDTIRGQLAELFHAVRTRDDSSRNFLLRVVQPGLAGVSDVLVWPTAPSFVLGFARQTTLFCFSVWDARAPK